MWDNTIIWPKVYPSWKLSMVNSFISDFTPYENMAFIKKHKGNFTKKIATFSSMSKSKKINFVKYSVIMTKKIKQEK